MVNTQMVRVRFLACRAQQDTTAQPVQFRARRLSAQPVTTVRKTLAQFAQLAQSEPSRTELASTPQLVAIFAHQAGSALQLHSRNQPHNAKLVSSAQEERAIRWELQDHSASLLRCGRWTQAITRFAQLDTIAMLVPRFRLLALRVTSTRPLAAQTSRELARVALVDFIAVLRTRAQSLDLAWLVTLAQLAASTTNATPLQETLPDLLLAIARKDSTAQHKQQRQLLARMERTRQQRTPLLALLAQPVSSAQSEAVRQAHAQLDTTAQQIRRNQLHARPVLTPTKST